MSNDLIRYSSPAGEALVRADLAKTLALTIDKYGLEGTGGEAGTPLGIINTPGIGTVTPTTVAADGNTMSEGDYFSFPSAVRENNAEFKAYIMRPQMYYNRLKIRSDAITASDAKGQFLWDQMRGMGTTYPESIGGYPVHVSNQVSITRTKGSGTTLTYIMGGDFTEVMIAMFGALEFAVTAVGDTAFAADQTWIRATMINDLGLRHAGAIAVADSIIRG
jgi:HK97 family phage major capsid protein